MYIKIGPTCFGAVTPSSRSPFSVLAKVTLVKLVSCITSVCGDVAAYISRFLSMCYVALFGSTAIHTHQKGPTNICSHITTDLITDRCIIIDYFNKV